MNKGLTPELRERLKSIRLVATDVDGVLTDGRLHYGDGGETHKIFHVRDGMGMRLLMENGIEVAVITARSGAAVAKRMSELHVSYVRQGCGDKAAALGQIMKTLSCGPEHVAFVGDDIVDLPAMARVGVAISVADGNELTLRAAQWITERAGGQGAFREVADAILDSQMGLRAAVDKVLSSKG